MSGKLSIITISVVALLSVGCIEQGTVSTPWAGDAYDANPEIRSTATTTFSPVPTLGKPIRVHGDQSSKPSLSGESLIDVEAIRQLSKSRKDGSN